MSDKPSVNEIMHSGRGVIGHSRWASRFKAVSHYALGSLVTSAIMGAPALTVFLLCVAFAASTGISLMAKARADKETMELLNLFRKPKKGDD